MKKRICLSVITVFAFTYINCFASQSNIGRVTYLMGNAMLKTKTAKSWKNVKIKQKVSNGDEIKTKKSENVEITLNDGSVIRIAEDSYIQLNCPDNVKKIVPEINKGRIWANIKKLSKRNYDFEITSGTATAAIRGTVVRMDNNEKGDSLIKVLVYDGKVDVGPTPKLKEETSKVKSGQERHEVSGPMEIPGPYEVSLMEWVTIVKGQQINIRQNGKYHKFKFDQNKDAQDPWVQFNKKRDEALKISH